MIKNNYTNIHASSHISDITIMASGSLPLPAQLVRRSGELVSTEQVSLTCLDQPDSF